MTRHHARLIVIAALLSSPTWAAAGQVTFTKDLAPILQRHCGHCHRPGEVAPMPLITYEQVRPYVRAIKLRTSLRDKPGVMPPLAYREEHRHPAVQE